MSSTKKAKLIDFKPIPGARPDFAAGEKTLVWPWKAVLDGATDDPYRDIIDNNLGQILLGTHPNRNDLYLLKVDMDMEPELPNLYIVKFHYSNRVPWDDGAVKKGEAFIYEPNPGNEPAKITRTYYTTSEAMTIDLDDKIFQTTANEQIFHQEEVQYRAWKFQKKVNVIPEVFRTRQKDGNNIFINSDVVTFDGQKFEKYELLIRDIECQSPEIKNKFIYYLVSFTMMYNPKTWLVKKRNAGFIYLKPFKVILNNKTQKIQAVFKNIPTAIKVGEPPVFPPHAIPLDADGNIYPGFALYTSDPKTGAKVLSTIKDVTSAKYLKKVFDDTQLTFRTKNAIKFTGNLPLE